MKNVILQRILVSVSTLFLLVSATVAHAQYSLELSGTVATDSGSQNFGFNDTNGVVSRSEWHQLVTGRVSSIATAQGTTAIGSLQSRSDAFPFPVDIGTTFANTNYTGRFSDTIFNQTATPMQLSISASLEGHLVSTLIDTRLGTVFPNIAVSTGLEVGALNRSRILSPETSFQYSETYVENGPNLITGHLSTIFAEIDPGGSISLRSFLQTSASGFWVGINPDTANIKIPVNLSSDYTLTPLINVISGGPYAPASGRQYSTLAAATPEPGPLMLSAALLSVAMLFGIGRSRRLKSKPLCS